MTGIIEAYLQRARKDGRLAVCQVPVVDRDVDQLSHFMAVGRFHDADVKVSHWIGPQLDRNEGALSLPARRLRIAPVSSFGLLSRRSEGRLVG